MDSILIYKISSLHVTINTQRAPFQIKIYARNNGLKKIYLTLYFNQLSPAYDNQPTSYRRMEGGGF